MENIIITLILYTGWPVLILMSVLILKRSRGFYLKLKDTVIGKLIIPTVFGWLFGMYALGIVASAYMLDIHWYYTVIPAFSLFLIAVIIVYQAMGKWEHEASELQAFYKNLEKLVKERTAELEKAHAEALAHEKEIQKLKDQFVFIAAHELRTPVTSIRWAIELALEEGKEKFDKDTVEQLLNIQDSNERLITLVDDLLNVARIEAGTIKITPQEIDLHEVISQTLKEMKAVFDQNKVKLTYTPVIHKPITTDKDRIKQVLINLLSNATKYNKKNGTITLDVTYGKKDVTIAVTDTGIGIKKEDQAKVFTKFGRILTDETAAIEGTGLGLYLCKEIINVLGGEIKFESTYKKGSTFTFTIPQTLEIKDKE